MSYKNSLTPRTLQLAIIYLNLVSKAQISTESTFKALSIICLAVAMKVLYFVVPVDGRTESKVVFLYSGYASFREVLA